MPGRSFQSLTDEQNKFKYQGKERDLETGYDYFEARFYDSAIGRFTSVDALAEKYPTMSPYTGMGNNPMFYTDPTGDSLKISGSDAQTAFEKLDETTEQITMSFDQNSGKVSVDQLTEEEISNLSPAEAELYSLIISTEADVSLQTTKKTAFAVNGKLRLLNQGQFLGGGKQIVNMEHASAVEKVGGSKASKTVLHEVLEGFFAAKTGSGFSASHANTLKLLPDNPNEAVTPRGQHNRDTGLIDFMFRLSSNPPGVGEVKGGSFTIQEYNRLKAGR